MDRMFSEKTRREVISQVKGKILEEGVGTGKNLPLYPTGCDVTGIDFSPEMLKRAKARVEKLGLNVQLIEMDAQNMDSRITPLIRWWPPVFFALYRTLSRVFGKSKEFANPRAR